MTEDQKNQLMEVQDKVDKLTVTINRLDKEIGNVITMVSSFAVLVERIEQDLTIVENKVAVMIPALQVVVQNTPALAEQVKRAKEQLAAEGVKIPGFPTDPSKN